jgi:uncharacterized protein (TIGR03083 family)
VPEVDLWTTLAAERRAIADRLDTLTPEQWRVRTLCPAWTVHDMAAHLVVPTEFTGLEMARTLLRARGKPDRGAVIMVESRSGAPSVELVRRLRAQAESRKSPPVIGVLGPYTDALVHALDMWIPLGLPDDRPADRWAPALDFLLGPKGRVGFLPTTAPSLRYVATDLDWAAGSGPEVRGPAAALALALLGRTPWLDRLDGPGHAALATFAHRAA